MSALDGWREEQQAIHLYKVVARHEPDAARARLFLSLADAAAEQAQTWMSQIESTGCGPPPVWLPDLRTRLVATLVALLGPRRMRPVLSAMKVRGMGIYDVTGAGHAMPSRLSDFGERHRGTGSAGNLRAAVFGVNDGLVSNASLILGMAGAAAESRTLLLTGIAGLLAGAFSMAAGEYVSVRSQREVFEYQIGLERVELAEYPQAEADELALIYTAKGMPADEARRLADHLVSDPERALDTLAREELGLNPDELGSPWGAATYSFLAFAAGAVIPLVPYLITAGQTAFITSIVLAAGALFVVGAVLSFFTGRNSMLSGLRMLAIGAAAGAATFGIGKLIGVNVA